MYWKHFGLKEDPFSLTADSRFLFLTEAHRDVLGTLRECIETERGFAALIAPPGVGKTTLLFELMEELRETAVPVFIVQTNFEMIDILRLLMKELGLDDSKVDAASLHLRFAEVLRHVAGKGRRFVLVVDEAQALNPAALETIRLLSNIELGRKKIVEAVFAGQQQALEQLLARPNLQQLKQRIAAYGRLHPFTTEETRQYVEHRVRIAGGADLFTPEALDVLAELSRGVARTINIYAFQALHAAIKTGAKQADAGITRKAICDFEGWPENAADEAASAPLQVEEDEFFAGSKEAELLSLLTHVRKERHGEPRESFLGPPRHMPMPLPIRETSSVVRASAEDDPFFAAGKEAGLLSLLDHIRTDRERAHAQAVSGERMPSPPAAGLNPAGAKAEPIPFSIAAAIRATEVTSFGAASTATAAAPALEKPRVPVMETASHVIPIIETAVAPILEKHIPEKQSAPVLDRPVAPAGERVIAPLPEQPASAAFEKATAPARDRKEEVRPIAEPIKPVTKAPLQVVPAPVRVSTPEPTPIAAKASKTATIAVARPPLWRDRGVQIAALAVLAVVSLGSGAFYAYRHGWFSTTQTAAAAPAPAEAAKVLVPSSPNPAVMEPGTTESKPLPQESSVTETPRKATPASRVAEIAAGKGKRLADNEPAPAALTSLGSAMQPNFGAALQPSSTGVTLQTARTSSVKPAVAIAQPKPLYPEMANRLGITGIVVLRVQVDAKGKPTKATVISGHPMLAAAAQSAVLSGWRFTPATLGDKPVESESEVRINFKGSR
jgi:general secretion pathway protein A